MRFTLLPTYERLAVKREYHIRLAIVTLFLLCVSFVIGIGALFPAFIQAYTEEQSQLATINALKKDKDDSGITAIELELDSDAMLLSELSASTNVTRPSMLVQSLISLRQNVKFTSLAVNQISTSTVTIIIQGVAPTRDSLIALKGRLEGLQIGNRVDLPISELTKSKDVQFSLMLTQFTP